MLRKILLPTIFLVLTYGFWVSPNFKQIAAGVAIFLFGMLALEQGFRTFTGGTLEKILRKTTSSISRSITLGILSTTVMQSSSLVSVITISFLSAGLITLSAGIGVVFGANLGTTTGAWLVAGFGLKVNIAAYAMPMLVFGTILILQKGKSLKGIGYILAGLGFLFLGIHYMKEGFEAFKSTIDLSQFALSGFLGLIVYCGIGLIATVVMQSSHAALALIITALATNQISYDNALALAIGTNIGTTITAIIGAISSNAEGKRLATAHLIFNTFVGLLAIIFIHQFVLMVENISLFIGIDEGEYTLKLAIFHTLFNLIGLIIMLPLIPLLERLLKTLFIAHAPKVDEAKYLTASAIDFPDTAVNATQKETLHIYENALSIIVHTLGFIRSDVFSDKDLKEIAYQQKKITRLDIDSAYIRSIKNIYNSIIEFISKAEFSLQMNQSADLYHLRNANLEIVEAVKNIKHLQKNMVFYINSGSQNIRNAYNNLRVQLTLIIRELEAIRSSEDGTDILSLDALKLVVDDTHNELNQSLSEAIHMGKIAPGMGTSLMNDSIYALNASKNLIQAAKTLFVTHDRAQDKEQHNISLNNEDLLRISGNSDEQ
ncbi:MAG: Na/Pi cotransporter family protein [Gammaproteobacteria bacterium]|nr:Na/Pi cotransporter family protein [Gammaproteobacteria bacterium]